jgi:conjugal transfer ATP-binding protein TraC
MALSFDKLIADLLGGPRKVDKSVPETTIPMLAAWLPYRSYDRAPGFTTTAPRAGSSSRYRRW